jgi:hypothetical protein
MALYTLSDEVSRVSNCLLDSLHKLVIELKVFVLLSCRKEGVCLPLKEGLKLLKLPSNFNLGLSNDPFQFFVFIV